MVRGRIWLRVPETMAVIVDAAAYRLVKVDYPFDVMLLPNLYGDILSDVAAGVVG